MNTTSSINTTGGYSLQPLPGLVAWVCRDANGNVVQRVYAPPDGVLTDSQGDTWQRE